MTDIDGPTGTFLTGVLNINGEPVTLCSHECACDQRHCGRVAGHPSDEYRHICQDCAELWIEAQP